MIATTLMLATNMSGLTAGTVAMLREPTGEIYVGFPFDKHLEDAEAVQQLFKSKGYILDKKLKQEIKNLPTYGCISCKIEGEKILYFKPSFLYSRP